MHLFVFFNPVTQIDIIKLKFTGVFDLFQNAEGSQAAFIERRVKKAVDS